MPLRGATPSSALSLPWTIPRAEVPCLPAPTLRITEDGRSLRVFLHSGRQAIRSCIGVLGPTGWRALAVVPGEQRVFVADRSEATTEPWRAIAVASVDALGRLGPWSVRRIP